MTESTNPEATPEEFDFDAWLDGVKRTERAVTVYGRGDLLAVTDKLEAELRTLASIPEADRSMADSDGTAVQAQIDALYGQLDKSKLELRVSFLDDEEQATIRKAVKKELKEAADVASREAAQEARESCGRAEIKVPADINQVVRRMTTEAANQVFEREISIRTLAACMVHPVMSVEQVRKLYTKIGDAQVAEITKAYTRASIEAPEVQVPKSQTPSRNDDGATSS